jgi:hypothetical protein
MCAPACMQGGFFVIKPSMNTYQRVSMCAYTYSARKCIYAYMYATYTCIQDEENAYTSINTYHRVRMYAYMCSARKSIYAYTYSAYICIHVCSLYTHTHMQLVKVYAHTCMQLIYAYAYAAGKVYMQQTLHIHTRNTRMYCIRAVKSTVLVSHICMHSLMIIIKRH